jgi:hypothetical protein
MQEKALLGPLMGALLTRVCLSDPLQHSSPVKCGTRGCHHRLSHQPAGSSSSSSSIQHHINCMSKSGFLAQPTPLHARPAHRPWHSPNAQKTRAGFQRVAAHISSLTVLLHLLQPYALNIAPRLTETTQHSPHADGTQECRRHVHDAAHITPALRQVQRRQVCCRAAAAAAAALLPC